MLRRFKQLLCMLATLAIFAPTATFAFYLGADDHFNLDTALDEDAYIAGEDVTIEQDINGDLFVGAGIVSITGNISQDIHIAAGEVQISGNVGDDVRVAGGTIVINGEVSGDVLVAGGKVAFGPNSVITGDVAVAAGEVVFWGQITGDLWVQSDNIDLAGEVTGSVKANGSKIDIVEGAVIGGDLEYRATHEATFGDNQVKGTINFNQIKRNNYEGAKKAKSAINISGMIFGFVASFLLGLVMLLIAPKMFEEVSNKTYKNVLLSTGIGFAFIGIAIIGIPLAFLTILGYKIALLMTLKLISWFIVIKVFGAYFIGHLYFLKSKRARNFGLQLTLLACGLLTWEIVGLIPVLGALAKVVITILATGGLCLYGKVIWDHLRSNKMI